jgi:predicted DNA-binding transcriptional regulator AlpA
MDSLLTERQVAERLSVSLATLRRRRCEGRPPAFVKIGASVRYRTEDIDAFVESSLACATGKEISQ